ncbi:MAG TPA: hypothetical protein VI701_02505 [Anaerolineales bacterium]|nr:hypothetical protein [Anaerolineales bacterium]
MLSIAEKLDRLAKLYTERDSLGAQKQALIDQVLPAEIRDRLTDIEAEFAQKAEAAAANIEGLEAEIKAETLSHGESVRAAGLQAVWNKGRQSWDSKGLANFGEAHPEVLQFRKEGEPSVTIRRASGKEDD